MMSTQLRFVATATLALGSGAASVAYAQSGNASDSSGPAQMMVTFAPLGTANATSTTIAPSPSTFGAVASVRSNFASGAAVISPATGLPIGPVGVQQVSALLTSGAPAALATVAAALNLAGAPTASVAELVQALALLSGVDQESAPAAVLAATKAFNALLATSSAAFLRNPPPAFLAIHAALLPTAASIGH